MFLSTQADIAIYGGAAGSGKTFALLLEPLRHLANGEFGAVIFRRTRPQITLEGGLFDESGELYPLVGMKSTRPDGNFVWSHTNGFKITFDSIQYDANRFDWQGSQIPLICYDELTHFSETIFWYLLSRNRSTCGVRPYIRATCNPDPDSWVAKFIEWWIDQDTGFPIESRCGVVRWLVRYKNKSYWYDSKEQAIAESPDPEAMPKSVTFIGASIFDNQILLDKDPNYLANLKALGEVEQARLLGGNWKIRPQAGKVFDRAWFQIVDAVPAGGIEVRGWDLAATEKTLKGPDPDYTAGVSMRFVNGIYYITDCYAVQRSPADVDQLLRNFAMQDTLRCGNTGTSFRVRFEHDPAGAGERDAWRIVTMLNGYDVMSVPVKQDKITRAKGLASQARVGNVKLLRGAWNEDWLQHMHNIPDGTHDDIMDASSCAFNDIASPKEVGKAEGLW